MAVAASERYVEFEPCARFAANEGPRARTRRAAWPTRLRLMARLAIGRIAAVIDSVGRGPTSVEGVQCKSLQTRWHQYRHPAKMARRNAKPRKRLRHSPSTLEIRCRETG